MNKWLCTTLYWSTEGELACDHQEGWDDLGPQDINPWTLWNHQWEINIYLTRPKFTQYRLEVKLYILSMPTSQVLKCLYWVITTRCQRTSHNEVRLILEILWVWVPDPSREPQCASPSRISCDDQEGNGKASELRLSIILRYYGTFSTIWKTIIRV